MEDINYVNLYIIVQLFSTYIIFRMMQIFLGSVVNKRKGYSYYLSYYLFDIFFYLVIKYPIFISLSKILLLSILTLLYQSSWKKRLYTIMSVYLFLLSTETIIIILSGYMTHSFFQVTNYDSIMGTLIIPIIQIIIISLLEQYSNLKSKEDIPIAHFIAIIFVPLSSILIIFYILQDWNVSKNHLMIILIFVLSINFSIFYLYDSLLKTERYKSKINLIENEHKYYQKQLEIMEITQDTQYNLKHDILNHGIFLYSLIYKNQNNRALLYLNTLINKFSISDEIETGRTDVDSILNFKILKASRLNIKVETDIIIPYELNVREFDVITILGNLMDNSIEAVKELPVEDKLIKLYIRFEKMCLIIRTTNKYKNEIKINGHGDILTSKKNINKTHGYGIKNIKNVLMNYHGNIIFKTENNIFKTSIILYFK